MRTFISIILTLLSWAFKLCGMVCFVFGVAYTKQLIDWRGSTSQLSLAGSPVGTLEIYQMMLVLAFFVPFTAGLLAIAIGFFIDLWLSIRRNNYLILEKYNERPI